jgi:CheY-like chemotaxis protein
VERQAPDVALVDISLGEDDGIGLTRRLLSDDRDRRVVLYTGSAGEELLFSGCPTSSGATTPRACSPRPARCAS